MLSAYISKLISEKELHCQTVTGLLPLAFTASLEEQRCDLAGQAKYFLTKALAVIVPWCPSLPSFCPWHSFVMKFCQRSDEKQQALSALLLGPWQYCSKLLTFTSPTCLLYSWQ